MSVNVEQIVRDYITKTVHMSLATVSGDKPWVCEVHFAHDDALNLYFFSKTDTRHCQEIAQNPNVAGNIIKQHELTEIPHGIYYEGIAEALAEPTEEDIDRYCTQLGRDKDEFLQLLHEGDVRHMYKITVSNWAIFGKFDQERVEKNVLIWNGGQK